MTAGRPMDGRRDETLRRVTPFGGPNASPGDIDEYALWDAAYELGSASYWLDGGDVGAIDEGEPNGGAPTMRPQVLNSLQAKVSHRWRRSRMVLVIETFIVMRPSGPIPSPTPPAAEASGLTMTRHTTIRRASPTRRTNR